MSVFLKLITLVNLEDLTNILCFFSGKFISEINDYSKKSQKFNSSCECIFCFLQCKQFTRLISD